MGVISRLVRHRETATTAAETTPTERTTTTVGAEKARMVEHLVQRLRQLLHLDRPQPSAVVQFRQPALRSVLRLRELELLYPHLNRRELRSVLDELVYQLALARMELSSRSQEVK